MPLVEGDVAAFKRRRSVELPLGPQKSDCIVTLKKIEYEVYGDLILICAGYMGILL